MISKKATPEERLTMILQDIESMIAAYKMSPGESAALFLAFAADEAQDGGMRYETFIEGAEDAWNDNVMKDSESLACQAVSVPNNGVFKGPAA